MHIGGKHPLASGRPNNDNNMQTLWTMSFIEKTQKEKESQQNVKHAEANSSYNSQVCEIFNSSVATIKTVMETFVKHELRD